MERNYKTHENNGVKPKGKTITQVYSWYETSGIKTLEVEPITGILQEVVVIVYNDICPLVEAAMDDICAIPHGIEHSLP